MQKCGQHLHPFASQYFDALVFPCKVHHTGKPDSALRIWKTS